jgi:hypothetical protein
MLKINKKKVVITIGLTGFPYSLAPAQKLLLIGKALIKKSSRFLVISNTFIKPTLLNRNLKKTGRIDGVIYHTASRFVFSPSSPVSKAYHKLLGLFREFLLINSLRRKGEIECLIVYSKSAVYSGFWGFYSRVAGIPCCLIYFELVSSLKYRKSFFLRLNDKFFDNHIFRFFNGVITISETLIARIRSKSPKTKYIKVPPLVDFGEFEKFNRNPLENYFLYCGTLSYFEVIEFLIMSYSKLRSRDNYKLYLVVNGEKGLLEKLQTSIREKELNEQVAIFSDLTYSQLIQMYVNAFALLIPLRNTPQDTARFPQKVAEYCAARRPIITTRFGELVNYFDDSSMIFSDNYDSVEFAEKMEFTINNTAVCERIAEKGYIIGKENFDYLSFSDPLKSFISNL